VTIEQIENRYYLHGRAPLTRIFVYEYLTGGGIDPDLAATSSLADLGALIVEGRLTRDALLADLHELDGVGVTVAVSRFETVPNLADPRRAYRKAAAGEAMTHFVARVAREHDYAWIIAPECDGLLLRMYDAVGATRWLGCAKEAVRLASSKSATAACLAAHDIATTPSLEPEQAEPRPGGRWVVKPDDGAGGLDAFVFDRLAEACAEYDARAAAGRNPVLQEWVDGEALSLSLIGHADGVELISINRQQITLLESAAAGRNPHIVEFDGVAVDQIARDSERGRELAGLAQRVAKALPGLRGFVGIDVVWHPQRGPVVIEVNPRLTVAYAGLSAALGRNLARDLLTAHGVHVDVDHAGRDGAAS
jgi:predicted ATP-grasp superfamily ATP-dependent carboligase